MGLKFIIKVLGKEFEEQPFFKRVFLNIHIKLYMSGLFDCPIDRHYIIFGQESIDL